MLNFINVESIRRKDNIVVTVGSKVHVRCRRRYVNYREYRQKKNGSSVFKRSARAFPGSFNSKIDRLFCGALVFRGGKDYNYVETIPL